MTATKSTQRFLNDAYANGVTTYRGNELPVSHVLPADSIKALSAASLNNKDFNPYFGDYLILSAKASTVKKFLRKSQSFVEVLVLDDDCDFYDFTLTEEAAQNLSVQVSVSTFGA